MHWIHIPDSQILIKYTLKFNPYIQYMTCGFSNTLYIQVHHIFVHVALCIEVTYLTSPDSQIIPTWDLCFILMRWWWTAPNDNKELRSRNETNLRKLIVVLDPMDLLSLRARFLHWILLWGIFWTYMLHCSWSLPVTVSLSLSYQDVSRHILACITFTKQDYETPHWWHQDLP